MMNIAVLHMFPVSLPDTPQADQSQADSDNQSEDSVSRLSGRGSSRGSPSPSVVSLAGLSRWAGGGVEGMDPLTVATLQYCVRLMEQAERSELFWFHISNHAKYMYVYFLKWFRATFYINKHSRLQKRCCSNLVLLVVFQNQSPAKTLSHSKL